MDEKTVRKNVGKRIKLLRKVKGYTQEELAEFCGTSKNNLSDIELGKHYPSLYLAIRLSFALTTNFNALFDCLLDYCADIHNQKCVEIIKELEKEDLLNPSELNLEYFSYNDLFVGDRNEKKESWNKNRSSFEGINRYI